MFLYCEIYLSPYVWGKPLTTNLIMKITSKHVIVSVTWQEHNQQPKLLLTQHCSAILTVIYLFSFAESIF